MAKKHSIAPNQLIYMCFYSAHIKSGKKTEKDQDARPSPGHFDCGVDPALISPDTFDV